MNVFGRSGETSESLQSNVLMTPSKNVHNSVYIDHPELSDLNYIPHDRWYPNYESHAFASHPNLWSNVQSSTRQPSTHGRSLHVPYSNLAHSGSINSHAIPSFAVHHSNDDTRGQMGNEKSYFTALNRPWTIKATARERDQLIERAERLRNEYDLITKRLRMLEIVDLDEKKSVFSVPITRRTNADSVYIGSGLQAPHCSENYSNNPLLEMQSISTFNDPNVTIWRLDNFADFHKQSIVGDFIASEPFAFEHPKLGLIGFYLRFEPKPIANANFTYLSMQLLNDHFQHSISMECNSWMEAIDKKRSQTKNVDFEFSKELTFKTWWFLSSEQVTEFAQSTSVFICCHLPYPVKSIGSISTNNIVYRWPITDFESRFNTAKLGISWKSDEFEVPGLKDVKLMVDFRPKGERKKYDDSSSIYLHATDLADHSKVPIHCVFWIENTESRLQKIEFTYVYYTMQSYGFPKYVKQEELLKFAENGPFDICCDVRAIIDPVPLPNRISFQSELASIFNDPYFSDAEIHVDNQIFKVSRAIISCKSPVFRAMFDKETTEQKSGVVTIKGFEVSMVEKMLIFIYKNEVVNLKECAAQLLPIADCYQVNDLLKKCTDSILDNLTIDNLLPILELAFEREHLEQFKYRVLKFAHQNCKEMQKLSKYESLLTRVPKIAIELLAIAYA